ncbi:hypothetical protein PanWU01x14_358160 [Parasponia andersonii]|uniref:Reverse transcriptase zinc-binding domain-containing protein n=1 Tax=Parasponia andersonii TaxID=3476 RepID=A0A2P5A8F1_PARAD|nr:hypothetical protein PanWU01x14_358160 [Parasponia andersonii]
MTDIPSKIKIFVWGAFHEGILSCTNLIYKKLYINLWCVRCGGLESTYHALFLWPSAKNVLEMVDLWDTIKSVLRNKVSNGRIGVFNSVPNMDFERFCVLLWCIWNDKN